MFYSAKEDIITPIWFICCFINFINAFQNVLHYHAGFGYAFEYIRVKQRKSCSGEILLVYDLILDYHILKLSVPVNFQQVSY